MDIETIAAGLIGSLFTILITKLIELFQKHQEHKYQLQKAFFERKLAAAEATVSEWYVMAAAIGGMARLYERPPILEDGFHPELFQQLLDKFSHILSNPNLDSISRSIALYFDFDEIIWDEEQLTEVLDKFTTVALIATEMRDLSAMANDPNNAQYLELIRERLIQRSGQLREELDELVLQIDAIKDGFKKALAKIRTEMKKYDV